jgi:hypothetical protein
MTDRPAAAMDLRKRLSRVFRHAVKLGWRRDNPVEATDTMKLGTHHTWTEAEIEQANADIQAHEKDQQRRTLLAQAEETMRRPRDGHLPQARGSDGASEQIDRRTLAERIRDATAEGTSRADVLRQVATEETPRSKTQRKAFELS